MGLKKFNKDKYSVLYLGQKTSWEAEDWLHKLQLCRICGFPQRASRASSASMQQKINDIMRNISKDIPNKSKKLVIPLYTAQYTRDVVKLQTAQQISSSMTKELDNTVYDQRLRELSVLSLFKQRLIAVFYYLRSGRKEELQGK